MSWRRLFRCGGGAFTSSPTPTPTPTPSATFPALVASLPTATSTLTPHAAAATTVTGNPLSALSGATYGQAYALGAGDYNPNIRGPDTDGGNAYGFNPSSPGTFSNNPVTFYPLLPASTTIGRVYQYNTTHTKWLNQLFTDKNYNTPNIITLTTDVNHPNGQIPHLYVDAGAGVAEFVSCTFRGAPTPSTIGDDRPHLCSAYDVRMDGCLIEDIRSILCFKFGYFKNCYVRKAWDQLLQYAPGQGSIVQDNLFIGTAGHATGSHVDYLHFTQISANATGGDTVQRNVMAKHAQTSALMAICIQHTDLGSGFTITGHNRNNNIIVNGQQDDYVARHLRGHSFKYETIITDIGDFNAGLSPYIQMHDCSGGTIDRCIIEGIIDNNASEAANAAGVNTVSNIVVCGRALSQGQVGSGSLYGVTVNTYSPYDLFFDPAWGGNATAGISIDDPVAMRTEYRRRFRPKINGPAKLGDGTYAGALFPDGSWNDGTVFAGSQNFAG